MRTFLLLAALTALFMGVGALIGGPHGALFAFGVACLTNFSAYWFSSSMLLSMYGAQPLTRSDAPQLYDMVSNLCNRADLPMPALYRLPTSQPNAFATGRNPQNAAVAVTEGLLQILDKKEVEGVLAHELAHIKNGDMLTMTMAATLAGAISMLAHSLLFMRSNRSSTNTLGSIILFFLAPLMATLIQFAISRSREYAADELGATLTGAPLELASALRKIDTEAHTIDNPEAEHHPGTAHLFIINPLHGGAVDNLFSTHPSTENRILRLEAMTQVKGPWNQ